MCWSGRLYSCLITALLGDVASGLEWCQLIENFPPPQLIYWWICYISRIIVLTAHMKEAGRFWHCGRYKLPAHILPKRFLAKPIRWGISRKMATLTTNPHMSCDLLLVMATLTKSARFGGESACYGENPPLEGGGGWLGLPSWLSPPTHKWILLFASFSLNTWHLPFFLDVNCSSWYSPSFWS